jgi:predicted dehydrogenase
MSLTPLYMNFGNLDQGSMASSIDNRQSAIGNPLRVGVIGLGPRWRQRYLPALAALQSRFRVAAVCDEIEQHAAGEAKRLGCALASGPTELVLNPAVEAILLLDPQWYRLWPLHVACRLGKPVYCCTGLDVDEAHADRLYQQLRTAQLPVLMAMTPRTAPVLRRLRELFDTQLGPPRLLLCEALLVSKNSGAVRRTDFQSVPLPGRIGNPSDDWGDPSEIALLDCCGDLLAGEPVSVLAAGREDSALTSVLLEFSDERAIQINRCQATGSRGSLRLRVVAERGTASVTGSNRVRWSDGAGRHAHALGAERAPEQGLLEQFYGMVRAGQAPQPNLDQVYRVLRWVRAAARSRAEGRRVEIVNPQSEIRND